jgi:predicted MPP superfamily phosphohydrolase
MRYAYGASASNEHKPQVNRTDVDIEAELAERLGPVHARQRLSIESNHEARVFARGTSFFHLENWYASPSIIRNALRLTGLYERAKRNALAIRSVAHRIELPHLPAAFEGFRVLHLSDLHIDQSAAIAHQIIERVRNIDYDLCVLTGDYRFKTHGDIAPTLAGLERLRAQLSSEVYAVLGNHDSIRMLPGLEAMGIRMLLNESVVLVKDDASIHLAGIDDAHYYGVGNIQKAAHAIPADSLSILLSHTPEVYRQAAHAAFDVLLCGHTHGGQICLPGQVPVTLDARIPRHLGRGRWQYQQMIGYTSPGAGTSVLDVRLNCPPEVTVHTLHRAQ